MADALAVRLGAPHRASEVGSAPAESSRSPGTPVFAGVARSRMTQEDLGLAVAHNRKVTTRLFASFRVEGSTEPSA